MSCLLRLTVRNVVRTRSLSGLYVSPVSLTIDTIGVTNTSIQSFNKPVGIGSKSDDLHGADRTRRRTSASVT